jgi:hypothetical protein
MARYQVEWKPNAEQQLAKQWLEAADRKSVTQATKEIEDSLASDPVQFGESREGDVRIAFVPPLSVLFSVNEQDKLVEVLEVGPS